MMIDESAELLLDLVYSIVLYFVRGIEIIYLWYFDFWSDLGFSPIKQATYSYHTVRTMYKRHRNFCCEETLNTFLRRGRQAMF